MLDQVRPQYALKFRCIGTQCEDDCCHGWDVMVDQETYGKYESLPALQPVLQERFIQITASAGDGRQYLIKRTASSACPFLTRERLCEIHKNYGENYLSAVCSSYPRVSRRIDGLPETALSLSCPEAARLVLLDAQLMPTAGEEASARYSRLLKLGDRPCGAVHSPIRFFWEIREFCLALLQDRSYALWQRLFLLGMFSKRLNEIIENQQVVLLPQLLRDHAQIASEGRLRAALEGIPVQASVQLKMLMEVVKGYLAYCGPNMSRIWECLQDFLHGTRYQSGIDLETHTSYYLEAYNRYYVPFTQRHPYLLENYLVNHIFKTRFPFGPKSGNQWDNPENEFVMMCLEFSIIKGLLIGMAGHYRETFSTEHAVKLIQAFAKSVEHNSALRAVINWQGLAESNSMAALLKN